MEIKVLRSWATNFAEREREIEKKKKLEDVSNLIERISFHEEGEQSFDYKRLDKRKIHGRCVSLSSH